MSLIGEVEKLSAEELREFLMLLRDRLELWGLMKLAGEALAQEWDNNEDAAYDEL